MPEIITPIARNYQAEFQQKQNMLGDIGNSINYGIQAGAKLQEEMKRADFINNLLVDLHKHHPEEQFVIPQGTTPEQAVALVKNYENAESYKQEMENTYKIKLPSHKLGMDFKTVKDGYDGMIEAYKNKTKGEAALQVGTASTQEELGKINPIGAAQIPSEIAKRASDINQEGDISQAAAIIDPIVQKLNASGKKFYREDILKQLPANIAQSKAIVSYLGRYPTEPQPFIGLGYERNIKKDMLSALQEEKSKIDQNLGNVIKNKGEYLRQLVKSDILEEYTKKAAKYQDTSQMFSDINNEYSSRLRAEVRKKIVQEINQKYNPEMFKGQPKSFTDMISYETSPYVDENGQPYFQNVQDFVDLAKVVLPQKQKHWYDEILGSSSQAGAQQQPLQQPAQPIQTKSRFKITVH